MKAVILDGSRENEQTLEGTRAVLEEELRALEWEVEVLELRDLDILPCTGCFKCWTRTPGICNIKDDGRDVARTALQSDLLVLLTPVTFGGYSSELKKALDRCVCLVLPYFTKIYGRVHHKKRYRRYPALAAVGTLPAPDPVEEGMFRELALRNSINAHSPRQTVCVIVNGAAREAVKRDIKKLLNDAGVTT